jgi:hypothetical protein
LVGADEDLRAARSINKKPEAKTHRIQIGGSAQQPQTIEAGGAQRA